MKPILFNTDMVKAILDGRKTVTRRVVKPQPSKDYSSYVGYCQDENKCAWESDEYGKGLHWAKSPYKPGDVLYVRETWQKTYINDGTTCPTEFKYEYKASDEPRTVYRWLPSIHMPKEAARIFLRVTNVRVERLQEITEEQAVKEGCITFSDKIGNGKFDDVIEFDLTAKDAFVELWNSTLKKDSGFTWAHKPWVWVIEFERITKEEVQA